MGSSLGYRPRPKSEMDMDQLKPGIDFTDSVRLSAKEISGIAARVLSAARMPVGCTGVAADAIDFLEFFSGDGLSFLDTHKEELEHGTWLPLHVQYESPTFALCDAQAESLFFAGPPAMDWLAALAFEQGQAAIVVRNMKHSTGVAALAYRLAARGLSCAIISSRGRENSSSVRAIGLCRGKNWIVTQQELPGSPLFLGDLLAMFDRQKDGIEPEMRTRRPVQEIANWLRAIQSGLQSSLSDPLAAAPSGTSLGNENICFVVAIESRGDVNFSVDPAATIAGRRISDSELSEARKLARRDGRVLDRKTWERLMTFADRSLIPTSEHSRLGAG